MIKAIKVVVGCPECWMGIADSCPKCKGTGEVEIEMEFSTFAEYVGDELEKHFHLRR